MDSEKERKTKQLLKGAQSWQYRRKETSSRLGGNIEEFIKKNRYAFEKNAGVVDIWQEALPEEFYEHCQLGKVSGSTLTLLVDAGPYMHELRLLSEELLRHIQTNCPRAGIRKITLKTRNNKKGSNE